MLDTLKFELVDYSIDPDNNLVVVPASIRNGVSIHQSIIYRNLATGYKIEGKKAYYNDPDKKFNVNISYLWGKIRCFVQVCIPSYHHDHNFYPVGTNEFKLIIDELGHRLEREVGIRNVNIWESMISRMDIFKNIQLDYPFSDYAPTFNGFQLDRAKNGDINSETFYLNYSEFTICIYDKINELKNRGVDVDSLPSENYARIEYRLTSRRKIKSVTNSKQLSDVNFLSLKNCMNDFLEKKVFKRQIPSHCNYGFLDYSLNLIRTGERFWRAKLKKGVWTDHVYNIEYFLAAMRNELILQGTDISKVKRQIKQLRDDYYTDSLLISNSSCYKRSALGMYEEIKQKAISG